MRLVTAAAKAGDARSGEEWGWRRGAEEGMVGDGSVELDGPAPAALPGLEGILRGATVGMSALHSGHVFAWLSHWSMQGE